MIFITIFYGFLIPKDLDDDFVDNVKLFVNHILSKEMLIAKRIHDKAVTGEDIVKYIKVSNYFWFKVSPSRLNETHTPPINFK